MFKCVMDPILYGKFASFKLNFHVYLKWYSIEFVGLRYILKII